MNIPSTTTEVMGAPQDISSTTHELSDCRNVSYDDLRPPLMVDFRYAHTDQLFTDRYLAEILRPGVSHPVDCASLYDTDYAILATAQAIIAAASAGHDLAAGLYVTIDGADTAWLHGVRVREEFRGRGYGSTLVRQTQTHVSKNLAIKRIALTVRCDNQGNPNEAATKLYSGCDFQRIGNPYPVTISGLSCDRHLGAVGTTFLTQRMEWVA